MKYAGYYNGFTIWLTYESKTHVRVEAEAYDSGVREGSGSTLTEALEDVKRKIDEDPCYRPEHPPRNGEDEISLLF